MMGAIGVRAANGGVTAGPESSVALYPAIDAPTAIALNTDVSKLRRVGGRQTGPFGARVVVSSLLAHGISGTPMALTQDKGETK
ncbi:protein of unknown function [Burkholderia multivorans]